MDREKVINGLEQFIADFKPYCGNEADWRRVYDALALLKAQELISDQDRKDLDILHRVKEGKLAKSLCRDYVIYNGEWYRNHKWDWPEREPLEPRIVDGEPVCGMCLYELRRDADSYCPCCGRAVKWE